MTTPRDAACYRICPSCNGVGESVGMDGYLTDCGVCRTRCVVPLTPDEFAALATPPAPETTLAELVDAYDEIISAMRNNNYFDVMLDQDQSDEYHERRAALLAYQPPAPVSRAGAVEELRQTATDLYEQFKPYIEDDNEWYRSGRIDGKDAGEIGEFARDVLALLAASSPAVAVSDEMVEAALKAHENASAFARDKGMGERAVHDYSMRAALRAALAAAEGRV